MTRKEQEQLALTGIMAANGGLLGGSTAFTGVKGIPLMLAAGATNLANAAGQVALSPATLTGKALEWLGQKGVLRNIQVDPFTVRMKPMGKHWGRVARIGHALSTPGRGLNDMVTSAKDALLEKAIKDYKPGMRKILGRAASGSLIGGGLTYGITHPRVRRYLGLDN